MMSIHNRAFAQNGVVDSLMTVQEKKGLDGPLHALQVEELALKTDFTRNCKRNRGYLSSWAFYNESKFSHQ